MDTQTALEIIGCVLKMMLKIHANSPKDSIIKIVQIVSKRYNVDENIVGTLLNQYFEVVKMGAMIEAKQQEAMWN